MTNAIKPKTPVLYLFLFPCILLYFICCIAPVLVACFYSLFSWDGGPTKTFLGLANYGTLLKDKAFWAAFQNNVKFILWTVVGQIGIALLVSMLLTSPLIKLKNFHRTVIFFPVILSAVVVGFLWRIIYNTDYGILNTFLRFIGQANLIKPWLDDPHIVITSLAIPKIWQYIGYYVVILLAAIQSIDNSILESARIDGAIGWKKLHFIVFPLIKDTVFVTILLCISGNMKTFAQIFVMTGGGPGNSSQVVALYAYQISMERMNYGYGSAVAIGILVLSLLMIAFSRLFNQNKKSNR
jgi:raffinose/stachyose/melibiose transport system permease protein